jgi:cyclic pyranopterin phosphate synthase
MGKELTHIDGKGEALMVDVGQKALSPRQATASGSVHMKASTLRLVTGGRASKGDVLAAARIAGIMAAKKTPEIIPLCHPVEISSVRVELKPVKSKGCIRITATVGCTGRTGVEMEALTAVSAAALTVYDMLKAADREMTIGEIRLLEKKGGRSGHFRRNGK